MKILFSLAAVLIFFCFDGSWAFADHRSARVDVPKEFLTCARDADCASVENDCAHCCGHGFAVSQSRKEELLAKIRANCSTYDGPACDCEPDHLHKWEPKCVHGSCEMKSTPISREAECKSRGGRWEGEIVGRGRLSGCNMPTKDGGKACRRGEDCEGVCLKDGTCSPWTLFKGCAHFKGHEGVICAE